MDTRLFSEMDRDETILIDFADNVLERNIDRKMQIIKTDIPTKYEILFDNQKEIMSPSLKSVNLSLLTYPIGESSPDKNFIVEFENIDVVWK